MQFLFIKKPSTGNYLLHYDLKIVNLVISQNASIYNHTVYMNKIIIMTCFYNHLPIHKHYLDQPYGSLPAIRTTHYCSVWRRISRNSCSYFHFHPPHFLRLRLQMRSSWWYCVSNVCGGGPRGSGLTGHWTSQGASRSPWTDPVGGDCSCSSFLDYPSVFVEVAWGVFH